MQILSGSVSVGAGASSGNVLLGSIFEFLKRPSRLEVAHTVPTGGAVTDMVARLSVGDTIVTDPPAPVLAEAAAGRGPVIPDDIKITTVGLPGDRLSLEYQNTTVGAIVVVYWVRVS